MRRNRFQQSVLVIAVLALAFSISTLLGARARPADAAAESDSGPLFLPMVERSVTPPTVDMILIPSGTFQMGCDSRYDSNCADNELPLHTVNLKDFFIDKYEVTNARYKACVDAGACTAPIDRSSETRSSYYGNPAYANYPVIHVDWFQAKAFCAWESKRLPTEAEWAKAARGGSDTRVNPWGNALPDCAKTNSQVRSDRGYCVGDTTRVGSYPAGTSPYGVMDMSGNVWEWVNDWYDRNYYSISPTSNPTGPTTGEMRNIRGGSWDTTAEKQRIANRRARDPNYSTFRIGFRCARFAVPATAPTASDDFCNPKSGWPVDDTSNFSRHYIAGPPCQYQIRINTDNRLAATTANWSATQFTFESVVRLDYPRSGGAGLLVGLSSDGARYYVMGIGTNGKYWLSRRADGAWTTVVREKTEKINMSGENRLRLVSEGNRFTLYLNDSLLTTVDDGQSHSGSVGLYAEGVADFDARFRNVALWNGTAQASHSVNYLQPVLDEESMLLLQPQ